MENGLVYLVISGALLTILVTLESLNGFLQVKYYIVLRRIPNSILPFFFPA